MLARRLVRKHNKKTSLISRIPDMAAKIFTVAQQKGGAGKTTLAAHLALALKTRNRTVAVVDIDPQQSLGQWFQHRAARFGEEDSGLTVTSVQGWRTQAEVQKLARRNDVVIIDSPPHAETEARIAIRLADLVIVPVQPSPMDVWASQATLDLAAGEKTPALLVLNRVPPRSRLTEEMLAEIAKTSCQLATTRIGNRVAFASALAAGLGVTEAQPRSRAAEEIKRLAKEIMRRAK
jgi:chromosome partitioning protein